MTNPEAAANELTRTVRDYQFKGSMINGTTRSLRRCWRGPRS
jgi:hypothetical protein